MLKKIAIIGGLVLSIGAMAAPASQAATLATIFARMQYPAATFASIDYGANEPTTVNESNPGSCVSVSYYYTCTVNLKTLNLSNVTFPQYSTANNYIVFNCALKTSGLYNSQNYANFTLDDAFASPPVVGSMQLPNRNSQFGNDLLCNHAS